MKKVVLNILIVVYVVVTILVTLCLVKYNQFNVTEFDKFTLVIPSKTKITGYGKNDLLVINKINVNDYKVNDMVFYYNVHESKVTIESAKITEITDVTETERTVKLNDQSLSSEYLIGNENHTKKYVLLGAILSILTSKYGYLITIIFPILVLFIYEVYSIVSEFKKK